MPTQITFEAGSTPDTVRPILTTADPVVVEAFLRALSRALMSGGGRPFRLHGLEREEPER
jgi:hypothetical protein